MTLTLYLSVCVSLCLSLLLSLSLSLPLSLSLSLSPSPSLYLYSRPGHINSLVSRAAVFDKMGRIADSLSDISSALEMLQSAETQRLLLSVGSKYAAHVQVQDCLSHGSGGVASSVTYSDEQRKAGATGGKNDTGDDIDRDTESSGGRGSAGAGERTKKRDRVQNKCVTLLSLFSFRASLYSKSSRPEQAISDLSEAINLPTEDNDYSQESVKLYAKKDDRLNLFFSRGLCLTTLGRHSEAIKDFSESLLLCHCINGSSSPSMVDSGEERANDENIDNNSNNDDDDDNSKNINSSHSCLLGIKKNQSIAHTSEISHLLLLQARSLTQRGYCHCRLNHLNASLNDYSQVVQITPHNVQVRLYACLPTCMCVVLSVSLSIYIY